MSLRISKGRIHATGDSANGFLIAFTPDDKLIEMEQNKTGSERFQEMVKEAIAARGYVAEGAGI